MLRIAPTARPAPSVRLLPRARLAALALTAATALPGAAFAAEPDSVTLNLMPLPGSHQQLDLKTEMRMTMAMILGPQAPEKAQQAAANLKEAGLITMRTEMRQTLTTTSKAADGSYDMLADLVTLKNEMKDGKGNVKAMPDMGKIKFKVGLKNEQIQGVDIDTEPGSPMAKVWSSDMARQLFDKSFDWMRKFNGTTLKVGESIELPMDLALPPGLSTGNGKMVGRYTLTSLNKGIADFDVAVKMDMALQVPVPPAKSASDSADAASAPVPSASAAAATTGQAAMTGQGSGKMTVRMKDRLMLRNDMTMSLQMDMAMPQDVKMHMTMEMDMQGVGKTIAAAKAPAPAKPKAATKG